MNIFKLIKFIILHPFNKGSELKAIRRFVNWQLGSLFITYPVIYPLTESSKLIIWKGLTGATGNIYNGLMEFEDMGFLLHFLREGDVFLDVGANVGVYSILASVEVKANSISIEPIKQTFDNLCDNLVINGISNKVTCLNIGLGSKKGTLKFTKSLDTINHVATKEDNDTVEVDVLTMDSILEKHRTPILIKIDVEGFETEVIEGGIQTLQNKELKAIIIELNGSGKRYGYDENSIHEKLSLLGFNPFLYDPLQRKLIPIDSYGSHNTIYLRDSSFVADRLISARRFKIGPIKREI